ncbi:hypothetical protein [Methyloprofundus sp.]|uniref:hypothetical protein n=1 Tax=Methyloprofundus sp. TaxID=2020875 RepID=UPI003D09E2EE
MQKKLLILLLILGSSHLAYAKNVFNDFLLAAQTDVSGLDPSVAGETDMNVVSGLIETAQFRFHAQEDNNPNVGQDEFSYEIRVKPKAWGQRAGLICSYSKPYAAQGLLVFFVIFK